MVYRRSKGETADHALVAVDVPKAGMDAPGEVYRYLRNGLYLNAVVRCTGYGLGRSGEFKAVIAMTDTDRAPRDEDESEYRYAPAFGRRAKDDDDYPASHTAVQGKLEADDAVVVEMRQTDAYAPDSPWARVYARPEHPRRQGAQRSLEEALVGWWSDGRLPSPAVTRDGLLMLEAGADVDESHRSLLLRAALYHRRGILTALKHQDDPERTAVILCEALLEADGPFPLSELTRLVREDPGSALWLPRLEAELVAPALSADLVRSQLANAALIHLTDPSDTHDPFMQLTLDEGPGRRRAHQLLLLIVIALIVASVTGAWAWRRATANLVPIPGGTYTVLNADASFRTVTLTPYRIDRFEVTNRAYGACVAQGDCPAPAAIESATRTQYFGRSAFADYPVTHVDRTAARAYCRWRGGRLPTESEWQVAASYTPVLERAYRYPWGEAYAAGLANDARASTGDTLQVGVYMPSGSGPWGIADMAGNVAEWTLTDAEDGMAVVKGGSYASDPADLVSGARQLLSPAARHPWLGFRCVSTPFTLW